MDVGLNPELTKWSMRSGPVTVLTGKGYKEHHWLVVPPSTTPVISTSPSLAFTLPCQCLLAPSRGLKTSTEGAVLPFGSAVKLGTIPTKGGPSPPSCLMKKDTA